MVILNLIIQYGKMIPCNFHSEYPIRFVNNGHAFCFKEARLSSTIGSDFEHNKFCGQISTIMKVITKKDDDLLLQFGSINENDIPLLERLADLPPQIRSAPHQKMLIDSHTDAYKGKIKGYIYIYIYIYMYIYICIYIYIYKIILDFVTFSRK